MGEGLRELSGISSSNHTMLGALCCGGVAMEMGCTASCFLHALCYQ